MKIVPVLIAIITLAIGSFVLFGKSQNIQETQQPPVNTSTPIPIEKVNIKASFKIITGSITRSFTNPKYHNKSAEVFISSEDPSQIHVTKTGVSWSDFFETLPMKLTKDCLTTGDGETFCDQKDGSLKFYLNDIEDQELLDKEIQDGDKALIEFKSRN